MAQDEKLSFSLSSKTKSSSSSRPNPSKRPQPFDPQDPVTDSSQSKPQFVTVFDPTETLDAPPKLVIAPIPNSFDFRSGIIKKIKNLDFPSDDHQHPESEPTKLSVDDSAAPSDNISYGLTFRSAATDDVPAPAPQKLEDLMLKRYREDMKNLPEDRGMDEFKDVPVDGFGAAILAGYGWSEGKGIGRNCKGDTKVVQYDRRAGTQGLGYQPSANDPIVKWKKMGYLKYLGYEVKYVRNFTDIDDKDSRYQWQYRRTGIAAYTKISVLVSNLLLWMTQMICHEAKEQSHHWMCAKKMIVPMNSNHNCHSLGRSNGKKVFKEATARVVLR